MDVGQGLLQGAKQSDFNITVQTAEVGRQAEVDGNAAAIGEAFYEPAGGGTEAGFVEQGRVKQVRHGASFGDAAVDDFGGL